MAAFLAAGLWLGAGSATVACAEEVIDRDAFLYAIAEVETGVNPRAVGRRGERGMYQFRPATWRQYTRRAFYEAHNPVVATEVASKHFDWLYDGLVRNGREPTPYLLAAAWNGGLTRTLNGRLPRATRDYATRVTNVITAARGGLYAATPAPAMILARDP